MTKEAFIKELTANIPAPPQYFFHDVALNKSIIEPVENVLKQGLKHLPLPSMKDLDE